MTKVFLMDTRKFQLGICPFRKKLPQSGFSSTMRIIHGPVFVQFYYFYSQLGHRDALTTKLHQIATTSYADHQWAYIKKLNGNN